MLKRRKGVELKRPLYPKDQPENLEELALHEAIEVIDELSDYYELDFFATTPEYPGFDSESDCDLPEDELDLKIVTSDLRYREYISQPWTKYDIEEAIRLWLQEVLE